MTEVKNMYNALSTAEILLPNPQVDLSRWAVVACDQFTAQPEYWHSVETIVGDAPSTLRMTLPEVWLGESDARIPRIHDAMARYLREGVLIPAVRDGFVLVERTTAAGVRSGCLRLVHRFRQPDPGHGGHGNRAGAAPRPHPRWRAGGTAPRDDAD